MATAEKERVRVDGERLERFVADAFVRLGMPESDAATTARGIVLADLRGHESHGVSNSFMGSYVPALRAGDTNPQPNSGSSMRRPSRPAGTRTGAWVSSWASG
jgi:LDH2 family malate/lactate/ureidoglycolate dehydrogenase